MKNCPLPQENYSDQKTIESDVRRTESRTNTNRFSKRCHIAIFSIIWVATCIPTNIIAAIFFIKTKGIDVSPIRDSPDINIDYHDGSQNISEDHRIKASDDWEEEVRIRNFTI